MVRVQAVLAGLGGLVGEEGRAGVRVFRGVPFAAPPVGGLRFRTARPVEPWRGDRDAREFARAAPQPMGGYGAAPVATAEDCLYLNVHAPAEPGPHPVLVWVHGGGYTQLGRWLSGGAPGRARELSDRMQQAWAAFVRGRTPVADGLPTWPLYEPTERRTMLLDVPATVVGDPDREERLGWDRAM